MKKSLFIMSAIAVLALAIAVTVHYSQTLSISGRLQSDDAVMHYEAHQSANKVYLNATLDGENTYEIVAESTSLDTDTLAKIVFATMTEYQNQSRFDIKLDSKNRKAAGKAFAQSVNSVSEIFFSVEGESASVLAAAANKNG